MFNALKTSTFVGSAPAAALGTLALALAAAVATPGAEAARPHEVMIKITHIKALDAIDNFSKGDFYARATIDSDVHTTPVMKQQAEVRPDWVITQKVAPGKHDLKLQIFDKDVSADDAVDVNPLANNRVLEATIDTRRCRISGYGKTYRCGSIVTVVGHEKKSAAVTFIVDVRK